MAHFVSESLREAGGVHPRSRRRRPPTSQAERERRQEFGAKWGTYLRQIGKQLQEANRE